MPAADATARGRLLELAKEYCDRTEMYDRTVCTGPVRNGGILPVTSLEMSLVNANARAVMNELSVKAGRLGFSPRQLLEAIQEVR